MNRDWLEKDFYAVLGVSKDASAKDIKKAYRKLAQRYHPDARPDDKEAEERFKEISEAHSVLSDPERRKEYDQAREMFRSGAFGSSYGGHYGGPYGGSTGGFGGQRVRVEDLGDLFAEGGFSFGGLGDLLGGLRGRRGAATAPQKGPDLTTDVHLSFQEAARGATVPVSVDGQATCRTCYGSGARPGTQVQSCPTCGGTGTIAEDQGFFSIPRPCDTCLGRGRIIPDPCPTCGGRGTEVRTRTIRVKVPAGISGGGTVRLKGKGGPGRNGGPPGDLFVKVHVGRHPVFGRKGQHLTVQVPISYTEAALGSEIEVPTLDGKVTLRIPPGTKSGRTFRVRGRGVERPGQGRGDLLVTVSVVVPTDLPPEARELLEQLRRYEEKENLRAGLEV
ncbi:MAG: molecular chaperone DnaJ [Actinomycetota bacterium]|nr:molecular chaperone DnaJ [Actinomycetota bacterium]